MALRTESVINFMAICRVQLQLESIRGNCHVPFDFSRLPNTRSRLAVDSLDLGQARREAAHKIQSVCQLTISP